MTRPEPDKFSDDGMIQINSSNRLSAEIHSKVIYERLTNQIKDIPESEEVWVVFSRDTEHTEIEAAFSHEILAELLLFHLGSTAKPVKKLRSEVGVVVDKYFDQVIHANKPYFVSLLDGSPVESFGPEATDKILTVQVIDVNYAAQSVTGTFWAMRRVLAVEQAQIFWKDLKSKR